MYEEDHSGMEDEAPKKESGWKIKLIRVLTDALADRAAYGTKAKAEAVREAAGDEPKGFKALSAKKK